jgi:hypothetical protein
MDNNENFNSEEISKEKTQIQIKFENQLLELIQQYQKDSLEPERVGAIKTLIRFALHEKGYLKNF